MGKMGKRSSADRPVRAHIGLVTPFQQKKIKTVNKSESLPQQPVST
jgi:hypothetical protein